MPNETHDWEAERERLRKQADEGFPPAWRPEEPDDEVFGTVVKVQMQAPTQYGPAPVVTLALESGELVSVFLFHTVLRRMFQRERVALGERVLIRWLGKRTPEGGGNAYDDYRLVVSRPQASGEPDWAGMAERYGDVEDEGGRAMRGSQGSELAGPGDDDIPF